MFSIPILASLLFLMPLSHADESHPLWDCQGITVHLDGPENVQVGDRITYRLKLRNEGGCDLRDSEFTDYIPRRSLYEDATPAPTSYPDTPLDDTDPPPGSPIPQVKWRGLTLPAGSERSFEVRIHVVGPPERVLLNSACFEHPSTGRICAVIETPVKP